eukprot:TRINITY_DN19405_c0_g1_i2.p1 TRINITY_DN19405_c0_g1~~TRINITY_DN19405_c0_g1_i2.p1  ORF type:complete len:336 (-),score=63.02 TRINITY_DN19405_c0_g1_i2:13-987(-)
MKKQLEIKLNLRLDCDLGVEATEENIKSFIEREIRGVRVKSFGRLVEEENVIVAEVEYNLQEILLPKLTPSDKLTSLPNKNLSTVSKELMDNLKALEQQLKIQNISDPTINSQIEALAILSEQNFKLVYNAQPLRNKEPSNLKAIVGEEVKEAGIIGDKNSSWHIEQLKKEIENVKGYQESKHNNLKESSLEAANNLNTLLINKEEENTFLKQNNDLLKHELAKVKEIYKANAMSTKIFTKLKKGIGNSVTKSCEKVENSIQKMCKIGSILKLTKKRLDKVVVDNCKAKVAADKLASCTMYLSLIHICRCRRYEGCRSRWSPHH